MNNDVLLGTTSCCEGTRGVAHSSMQDTGYDIGVQAKETIALPNYLILEQREMDDSDL